MRQNLIGILNGDIQLFLQPSQALEQALLCSVQQQFSISNSETFCRPRRRSLVINAVSVKKARKLFGTSFENFLSLNPFGMKLLVIGRKTALAFLTKNSLLKVKIFITKPQLKSYLQSTCCYKKSNWPRERYYKPGFPSSTFNLELYDLCAE